MPQRGPAPCRRSHPLEDNDHGRELLNAQLAKVEAIGAQSITVSSLVDGTVHQLTRDDHMPERLDLAYALNFYIAQGVTTGHGIVMMSANPKPPTTQYSFLVAMSRIAIGHP